jgi:predicted TIM-barrel fold metal-dependent hydrolase
MSPSGSRYILVSSDAHAGADLRDYKAYLPAEYHDEFDAWAAAFHDPWADFDLEVEGPDDEGLKMGRVSFVSPYSWESDVRLKHMDQEGIAAEVVFPNTVPPFYPSGVITAPAPSTTEEYRYRWAGIRAHNRWLADFCAAAPGRRLGLAQIFINDIDEAVSEVRWAKQAGLAGVLMPGDHMKQLVNIYKPRLDPFWAVCSDLNFPVHRHATSSGETEEESGPPALAIGAHEIEFFFMRGLSQLVFGGVFERFPELKFVFTESSIGWVPNELAKLDAEVAVGKIKGHAGYPVFGKAVKNLQLSASEYWQRNCWFGASLLRPPDMALRHQLGVDKLMWGADYPHTEGSFPYSRVGLRLLFSDVPEDEIRLMTSGNAAVVYDLDLGRLQKIADEIGPTVEEVATPVTRDELPTRTMSATVGAGVEAFARA